MNIGLIDDGKLPNLALMKLSTYYKKLGCNNIEVCHIDDIHFQNKVDKVFCSIIFPENREKAYELQYKYRDIDIGGTGWLLKKTLPEEVEKCNPDYDLYSYLEIYKRIRKGIGKKESKIKKAEEIVNAGIGFSSRGCPRSCGFCYIPIKEGKLVQASKIEDIINPRSRLLILLDNNFTADPYALDKLKEVKERNLVIDISQGIDVRLINEDIAKALSEVKHLRSLHYAWDCCYDENVIIKGINNLSTFVPKYKQMCFMLTGYNSTFSDDFYRFEKLNSMGVNPYVMRYNNNSDVRLKHFARWVNSRIYKVCTWNEYEPWAKAKDRYISENIA